MNIYLDLETIPAQSDRIKQVFKTNAEKEKQFIKAPANYKDEEKILDYISNKAAEIDADLDNQWRKTSFDGGFGHICVIGYALDDGEPITIYNGNGLGEDDEAKTITQFYDVLRDAYDNNERLPVFVGHNIISFDLRFLLQRSIVLGIVPPSFIPIDPKPWSDYVYDTMTKWAGAANRVSLNKLCEVFDMPLKGAEFDEEFDGSMVWEAIKNGEIEKVATYCAGDIYRTREIFKRMTFA